MDYKKILDYKKFEEELKQQLYSMFAIPKEMLDDGKAHTGMSEMAKANFNDSLALALQGFTIRSNDKSKSKGGL